VTVAETPGSDDSEPIPARVLHVSGKRLGLPGLVLAIVLVASGCGGGDEGSAESWANSVCSDLSEWITDVDEAATSLTNQQGGFDEADIRAAIDQIRAATDELAGDLRQLGPPEVEAGQEAQEELDQLSTELREQLETVQRTLETNDEPLELAAAVAGALARATSQLQDTFEDLQGLDRGGELEDAFRNSEDCDSLREQAGDSGS
jgi:methyl-accepting chemotaxis protein